MAGNIFSVRVFNVHSFKNSLLKDDPVVTISGKPYFSGLCHIMHGRSALENLTVKPNSMAYGTRSFNAAFIRALQ